MRTRCKNEHSEITKCVCLSFCVSLCVVPHPFCHHQQPYVHSAVSRYLSHNVQRSCTPADSQWRRDAPCDQEVRDTVYWWRCPCNGSYTGWQGRGDARLRNTPTSETHTDTERSWLRHMLRRGDDGIPSKCPHYCGQCKAFDWVRLNVPPNTL